jgi:hypothetical protein
VCAVDRFDKELKNKLDIELRNIRLSDEALLKIKEQVKPEKKPGFRNTLTDFLNYEIRIPYRTCIAVVAAAAFLGISSFTVTDKDIASFTNKNIIEISGYWEEVN